MSNSTHTARKDRREEQLTKDVSSRRPLLSALSVLVGTGVVAFSALPSKAEAKSALDEMAWLPQHTQLTQDTGTVLNATAPKANFADAANMATPVGAQRRSPAVVSAMPVEPAQRRAEAPARSRGFADSGLVSVDDVPSVSAVPVTTVQRPAEMSSASQVFADSGIGSAGGPPLAPTVGEAPDSSRVRSPQLQQRQMAEAEIQPLPAASAPMPVQNNAAARMSVALLPIRTASGPAVAAMPTRDMQADIQSMRGSMAAGQTPKLIDSQGLPPGVTAVDTAAKRALSIASGSGSQAMSSLVENDVAASALRSQRKAKAHPGEQNYSDWLDDSASASALADRSVVPEQAVRTALRNAVETAGERSASVRQARTDWEAAKFDVDQVKGQRWPQVQVGGNSPSLKGSGGNAFDDTNLATASVSVTTTVYDWGKTSKNIDSRAKTAEAAEFYYQAVAQQNAYEVSSDLVELAKNRAVYAIGVGYVKRMAALVEMLAAIVKVDPGRLSELSQAKARLLQAQTSQEVVAAQVRSLELSVRKLVGDLPTPMPTGTHWQLRLDSLDSAVAAIPQNPAIEQAIAETAAASATAKSVRAASLPQLNWVINKTTAHDTFGQRQPWTTMLQLSWTPFQGGSQRAAERAALARASSSSDKREQLQLDSEYKVRDAHRDAIALSARTKLYADLSTETDLVRKQFFEQWYHLNRRTLVDVLGAENDFYNNQVSEVTTQFDAYQSILKIHLNNGTLAQWLQET